LLGYIWNNDTSIYNQTVTAIAYIVNTNATLYAQILAESLIVDNINSTIYDQVITQLMEIYNKPNNAGGDNDVVEDKIYTTVVIGFLGLFGFMFVIQIPAVQDVMPGKSSRKKQSKLQVPPQLRSSTFKQADEPWERRKR